MHAQDPRLVPSGPRLRLQRNIDPAQPRSYGEAADSAARKPGSIQGPIRGMP